MLRMTQRFENDGPTEQRLGLFLTYRSGSSILPLRTPRNLFALAKFLAD